MLDLKSKKIKEFIKDYEINLSTVMNDFSTKYWETRDEEDMDDCDGFWSDLFDHIEEQFHKVEYFGNFIFKDFELSDDDRDELELIFENLA